jgi:hypothetical protein
MISYLKKCDINGPLFIDLRKIYRSKKSNDFEKSHSQNRSKNTKMV